jgi:hypothetical protein
MARSSTWTTPRDWTTGETPTATIMNAHVGDNLTYLYAPGDSWTTFTLTTGVYQFLSSPQATRASAYRQVAGSRVQFRGTIQLITGNFGAIGTANDVNGGTGGVALPAGLRPGQMRSFAVATSSSISGRLDVLSTGVVRYRPATAADTWFSLEGIEFDINN